MKDEDKNEWNITVLTALDLVHINKVIKKV